MFSHVNVGARDLLYLARFYDAVLAPLGLTRADGGQIGRQPGVLWRLAGRRWPQFCVQPPFNGLPATWGNGVQVSFAAPTREAVDLAWRAALAHGGADEGAPGLRSNTRRTSTPPIVATQKATSCASSMRAGCERTGPV